MRRISFFETSPERLSEMINEGFRAQIDALEKRLRNQTAQDDLLTREQAAKLLQIHETTLYHWTNAGKVTSYSIAGKRYYKRSEILASLIEVKK